METSAVLLWFMALSLIATGLAGLLFPALPGVLLIFGGLLLAAWAEDFSYVGAATIAILALLAALSYAVDLLAGAVGAKKFGASKGAVLGAATGAVVGMFFGLPGILLGPFAGGAAGELLARRNLKAAGRAGIGASFGFALGLAAKLMLAFAMLGVFVIARFL